MSTKETDDNNDNNIKDKLTDIKDKIITTTDDNTEPVKTLEKRVSTNAKKVLISLFITLFGIVGLYSISLAIGISVSENLNAVFIAAVTGIITLGGTLVTNLWGK